MTVDENRQLIVGAFAAWSRGERNVFRLLADDATWTIAGSTSLAGTYHGREEFMAKAIRPISAKLAQPIVPTVERVVAGGDTVAVMWRGHAVAIDGSPYDNHYCWVMRLVGDKIVEVTAFLDLAVLHALMAVPE